MPNFNKVILAGHLTRDPEMFNTAAGTAICKGGLAVSEKFKTKDGEARESVCFVDFVIFGIQGETFKRYMGKGDPVLIEGKLNLEQWEDKATGAKRSKHTIKVDNFQFLRGRQADKPSEQGAGPQDAPPPSIPNDDIPF